MKTTIPFSVPALILTGLVLGTLPARATDTSKAIQLCDANPSCTMRWSKEGDSITITVKGSNTIIDCPKVNGPCVTVRLNPNGFGHAGENGGNQIQNSDGNNAGGGQVGGDGGGQIN